MWESWKYGEPTVLAENTPSFADRSAEFSAAFLGV
ncbi:hypothetical protein PF008_g30181 [Phytophthora fragariae]|uniref:Uncharacterized protein n=1 Tax=Phytophthora fragariae TaxID=53985 RepID=A0A6G0Q6A1_9STRA|nr:hypothetical protein PF008_g30181 [Phytophthora fragariae]